MALEAARRDHLAGIVDQSQREWTALAYRLVVAGLAFIVPAMLITGAFGSAYVGFGSVPAAGWLLYGVKPVILGVILQAIFLKTGSILTFQQLSREGCLGLADRSTELPHVMGNSDAED